MPRLRIGPVDRSPLDMLVLMHVMHVMHVLGWIPVDSGGCGPADRPGRDRLGKTDRGDPARLRTGVDHRQSLVQPQSSGGLVEKIVVPRFVFLGFALPGISLRIRFRRFLRGRPARLRRSFRTPVPFRFRFPATVPLPLVPGGGDPVPVRVDDLLLTLLGRALERLPAAEAELIAEEVGQQYGEAMATHLTGDDGSGTHRSLRTALQAVADALTAHGFAAHTDRRNDSLRIVTSHCPFGDVAIEHPVICAVDRGMVKGMLRAIYGEADPTTSASLPRGDTFCETTLVAQPTR